MAGWWMWSALLVIGCAGSDGDADATDADATDAAGDDDDDDLTGQVMECTDDFVPCGGDPVAVWDVTGFCSVPIEGITCDELVVTIVEDRSTGVVEIRSDGTYTRTNEIDLDAEVAFPLTCIAPIPCALIPPASGGIISSCVDDGTTCTCQATVTETDTASGGWVMDGNDFVADGDHWPICVTGNEAIAEESSGARVHWRK